MGCFAMGCLIVCIVLACVVVIGGVTSYFAYQSITQFVNSKPVTIPVSTATPADYAALVEKFRVFFADLNGGHAATVTLSANELNDALANGPDSSSQSLRGQVYFSLVNNQLVADCSCPLNATENGRPRQPTYWFNGKVYFTLSYADEEFGLQIQRVTTLDGKPAPGWLMLVAQNPEFIKGLSRGFVQGFRAQIKDPTVLSTFDKVTSIKIQNDQIVLSGGGSTP